MTTKPNKLKRLFFALQMDSVCQQKILAYQQQCQDLIPLAKATSISNLHLTLHFMGLADEAYTECLHAAAATVLSPSITGSLDITGYFKKPKIAWLGCKQAPQSLINLHQQLAVALQNCGYYDQHEVFVPHVTLFRKFNSTYLSLPMPVLESISFTANRFVLMESISTDVGVQYQPIQSYTLK